VASVDDGPSNRAELPEPPPGSVAAQPKTEPHPTSIAVWGVPSPLVVNHGFVARVGVKCAAGCPLGGRSVAIRDEAGIEVGRGRVGAMPEAGTSALYAAEVRLQAPAEPAVHAWTAAFDGAEPASHLPSDAAIPGRGEAAAAEAAPAHASAIAAFGFRTVSPPQHRVMVTVCDRDTTAPLVGAEVRVGAYRGTTDASGKAAVEVHPGSHDLYVRKAGYKPHAGSVPEVSGDVILEVAAERATDADLDDQQVWM
jgi:hypothetical protein